MFKTPSLSILIIIFVLAVIYIGSGPSVDEYKNSIEPRFLKRSNEFVLQKKLVGDPNVVGADAFGILYKKYYSSVGYYFFGPTPKARWPLGLEIPKSQWEGHYALAVTLDQSKVQSLSDGVEYLTWDYGDIAEILHVGPYSEEKPIIDRLLKFIESNNKEIVGDHEEEYVRGPKLFGLGDPKKFLTIIRYRIREKEKQ